MFAKVKEKLQNGIIHSGRNFSEEDKALFSLLSENNYNAEFTEEQIEIIKRFEEMLDQLFEAAQQTPIEPFKFETTNAGYEVPENTVFHRCPARIDTLRGISDCGVMASEWFGRLEEELEGRLCAFLNQRIKRNNSMIESDNLRASRLSPSGQPSECVIYFDKNNPLLKTLMNLDFFEYAYLREHNPEEIEKRYSPGIIELYEKVILPISPNSKHYHNPDRDRRQSSWMAIPGGIPAQLINGICIHSANQELMDNLKTIAQLYPRATIIDETGKVLHSPENTLKQENIR